MSKAFQSYWTSHAINMQPNSPKNALLKKWPLWDPTNEINLQLDSPIITNQHLISDKCNFWDQLFNSTQTAHQKNQPGKQQW
jgi:hypothetical protein